MSKNLRVFFLSALVVLLAVSSVFAASLTKITINSEGDDEYYAYNGTTLTIYKDGHYIFDTDKLLEAEVIDKETGAQVETLDFSEGEISNVIVELPAPTPDQPGYGTNLTAINFPETDSNGDDIDKDHRASIKIEKGGTNTAIVGELEVEVPTGIDLTIDVPFRVNADNATVAFNPTVTKNATLTLGTWVEVFCNTESTKTQTGFIGEASSTYTIESGGELIVQNAWAIRGSGLTVENSGTLTFDLKQSALDLRGVGDTTTGAQITMNGGKVKVNKDLKLTGAFEGDTFEKIGSGTLTLSQAVSNGEAWPTEVLPDTFTNVTVSAGKLVLDTAIAGYPIWAAGETAELVVNGDTASFEARTMSVAEGEATTSLTFKVVNGNAKFGKHAVIKGKDEIYPYDKFISKNNGIKIDIVGVSVDVAARGTVTIEDGAFALDTLKGNGTVVINNTNADRDESVLIFTNPEATVDDDGNETYGYNQFKGKIQGTNANVGLYAPKKESAPYKSDILSKAAVTIENLIVYGPAKLEVSPATKLENVKNIYLRGHRPGADNTDTEIANSRLTVGKLVFVHSDDQKDETIELNSIKIDGTANPDEVGTFRIDDLSEEEEPQASGDDEETTTLFGLDVKLSNITLFANKGTGKDFPNGYVTPEAGIYAVKFDGTAQPSRFRVSGMTGEGLAEDIENKEKVYSVKITDSSDVRFLPGEDDKAGTEHRPIGTNTSLLVGQDAKLEMARGAVIDGHLTFKGSTNPVAAEYSSDDDYPQEDWFASKDNNWNLESLDGYSTFTTVVAKANRVNAGSEYAVKVGGELAFSQDVTVTPSQTEYPGRVLVRTKTNTNAFDGVTETTLQRFKVIGDAEGDAEKYLPDFATVYNDTYKWRISPYTSGTTDGVVVEMRSEVALLSLGKFAFTRGADTFGNGDFVAEAAVSAWAEGEKLTIRPYDKAYDKDASGVKYVLTRGSNEKYYISDAKVVFRRNDEGEETAVSNIYDESEWSSTFSSPDVLLNGSFHIAEDGTPKVTLRGSSYGGYKFTNLAVMLRLVPASFTHTMAIDGVLPAFVDAPLSPVGYGDEYSTAETRALPPFTFIGTDSSVNASFTVKGLRESTVTTQGTFSLVNGTYVWSAGEVEGVYFLPDKNGVDARLSSIKVVRFDDSSLEEPEDVDEDPTVTYEGGLATVAIPSTALGDTGDAFVAKKWLALVGTKADGSGTITTAPVAYTLIKETAAEDIVEVGDELSQTVETGTTGKYDVFKDFEDETEKVTLVPVDLPDWLGYDGGGETISYTVGDLTNVDPGEYTFQVLGYAGSKHKVYQFKVTVGDGAFTVSASPASVTFASPTADAQTVTLSSNKTGTRYDATVDKNGLTASVSESTLTLTPSAAGSYVVTVTGTNGTETATATVSVTVEDGSTPPSDKLTVSVSKASVTFASLTADAQTVTLSSNKTGTRYDATVDKNGLTASVSESTLTLTPSAAGSYVVTVTGTNGTETATATVSVTVEDEPLAGADFMFTRKNYTLSVAANTTDTSITLAPTGVQGTVAYTPSVEWVSVNSSTHVVTVNTEDVIAGTYEVTINAVDSPHDANYNNSDSVTITITVTSGGTTVRSSGGGCDAGFGALALILAAPLFLRRRRS